MNSNVFCTLVFFFLCLSVCQAQVNFHDGTKEILGNQEVRSTIAIGVDDVNGDHKDDLILLDEGLYLKTFQQRGENVPFKYNSHSQTSSFGEWSIITGDLDNDGFPEVISSGSENGSEILFRTNGLYIAKQITPALFSQNTNLVDLDIDGDLDLFVCNDTGENATYLNDGSGFMTKVSLIDFKTSEEDDMSGNYSSIFTDIDSDGDLDLYIGKCRAGVTDPTDRRRVNTLYVNQGDGTYIEGAESFGLANGSQTWSVDAGDVDNDGDIDLIIANHDRTHDLMINNGDGSFSRFDAIPENVESFAYQSFFGDFDNNGWLDIFITEPSNSYILYNCEMSFSTRDIPKVGVIRPFSGASGDFNDDGFLDLYLSYASTFQTPGVDPDVVYLNDGNNNNYLDISLIGTVSNRDAIGSKVEVYAGGLYQMREVKAGQSYGIMNSTIAHFGLGTQSEIDSIVITWPTGEKSISIDIEINNKYIVSEDNCFSKQINLPDLELCDGLPVLVELPDVYDEYYWSEGSISSSLDIANPGSYSLRTIKNGCESVSNFFTVRGERHYAEEEIIVPESLVGCNDQVLKLEAIDGIAYQWNTGANTKEIKTASAGIYQVTVTTNCSEFVSEEIEIQQYETLVPEIVGDTVDVGEEAILTMSGDHVEWFQYKNDEAAIFLGNDYQTIPLINDTSFFVGNLEIGHLDNTSIMSILPLNVAGDSIYNENDTLPLTVYQPIRVNSFKVRTQKSGWRSIEIWNNDLLVWDKNQYFEQGSNTINLQLFMDEGEYTVTTNENVNLDSLGHSYPSFSYSKIYAAADRKIKGYLRIGESVLFEGATPYFFDWDIDHGFYDCEDRYEVEAIVDESTSVIDVESQNVIFPNPTGGVFNLKSDIDYPVVIDIYGFDGQKIRQTIKILSPDEAIDVSSLLSGIYICNFQSNGTRWIEKLVIR